MFATKQTKRKKSTDTSTITTMMSTGSGFSPKDRAKSTLSLYLASLPKAISLIGNSVYTKHFKLQLAIDQTNRRIDALEPAQPKFPASMRFKFELKTTDALKETPEFKRLATEASGHLEYCRSLLRSNCRSVALLELGEQQNELRRCLQPLL